MSTMEPGGGDRCGICGHPASHHRAGRCWTDMAYPGASLSHQCECGAVTRARMADQEEQQ
jgi:hypothetical protein